MSRRDHDIFIQDILDCCKKIQKYIEGYAYDQFKTDDKTIDAVIRNFEIIGEAANKLSEEFKDANDFIDWHK